MLSYCDPSVTLNLLRNVLKEPQWYLLNVPLVRTSPTMLAQFQIFSGGGRWFSMKPQIIKNQNIWTQTQTWDWKSRNHILWSKLDVVLYELHSETLGQTKSMRTNRTRRPLMVEIRFKSLLATCWWCWRWCWRTALVWRNQGPTKTRWSLKNKHSYVSKSTKNVGITMTKCTFLIGRRIKWPEDRRSPETVVRGRSHSSRREAEGKDPLWQPGLNISALRSDSKSATIRKQGFTNLTLVE